MLFVAFFFWKTALSFQYMFFGFIERFFRPQQGTSEDAFGDAGQGYCDNRADTERQIV